MRDFHVAPDRAVEEALVPGRAAELDPVIWRRVRMTAKTILEPGSHVRDAAISLRFANPNRKAGAARPSHDEVVDGGGVPVRPRIQLGGVIAGLVLARLAVAPDQLHSGAVTVAA